MNYPAASYGVSDVFRHAGLDPASSLSFYIGVGTSHWIVTPLPPNRTGGSPASGSPVGGSPTRGPEQGFIGFYKAEKPMLPKEWLGQC